MAYYNLHPLYPLARRLYGGPPSPRRLFGHILYSITLGAPIHDFPLSAKLLRQLRRVISWREPDEIALIHQYSAQLPAVLRPFVHERIGLPPTRAENAVSAISDMASDLRLSRTEAYHAIDASRLADDTHRLAQAALRAVQRAGGDVVTTADVAARAAAAARRACDAAESARESLRCAVAADRDARPRRPLTFWATPSVAARLLAGHRIVDVPSDAECSIRGLGYHLTEQVTVPVAYRLKSTAGIPLGARIALGAGEPQTLEIPVRMTPEEWDSVGGIAGATRRLHSNYAQHVYRHAAPLPDDAPVVEHSVPIGPIPVCGDPRDLILADCTPRRGTHRVWTSAPTATIGRYWLPVPSHGSPRIYHRSVIVTPRQVAALQERGWTVADLIETPAPERRPPRRG